MDKLDTSTAASLLANLPHWQHDQQRGAITREFRFHDFIEAFAFMTQLAIVAEKRDHHPEWSNVYNKVVITMTTHDAGGLTRKDTDFAACADQAFVRFAGLN
ncbi:MAG: 4a-hydroxytetrahydrobiopterin dehydratase [Janthinobacterium lividum]